MTADRPTLDWYGDITSPEGIRLVGAGIQVFPTDHNGGGYYVRVPGRDDQFVRTADKAKEVARLIAAAMQERAYQVDFERLYLESIPWSDSTFGGGRRTNGILLHILKEIKEVEADPTDPKEWIDIAILALDGAWRTIKHDRPEYSPTRLANNVIGLLCRKYLINRARTWGKPVSEDQPVEHVRGDSSSTSPSPST